MSKLFPLLLLPCLLAGCGGPGFEPVVEAVYQVEFDGPKSDKTVGRLVEVLRKRLASLEVRSRVERLEGPELRISLGGITPDRWPFFRRVLERRGSLKLQEVADEPTHGSMRERGWPVDDTTYKCHPEPHPEGGRFEKLVVFRKAIVTNLDIAAVTTAPPGEGPGARETWTVNFTLTEQGSSRFRRATARLAKVQGRIAIVLDGKIKSAPVVRSEIPGAGVIEGLDESEARALAVALRTGRLPAALRLMEAKVKGE